MQASLTPERWEQIQQLFDEVVDLDEEGRVVRRLVRARLRTEG